MKQLIECVPNFSEGRDMEKIKQITNEIESVEGVKLLDVDPGKATNRTVVTIVGEPHLVIEAAFRAIKKAASLIDMSKHSGAHPRFGATDVCPLIPVANITMDETIVFAHKLSERVGSELGIPIYNYEFAAKEDKRKNLANCRSGEYEALSERINTADWKPDYGVSEFSEKVSRSGATAIGARNFLIAYNVNLNTTSTRRANSVAFDVRERGRVQREGDSIIGKIIKDDKGNPMYEPGLLKSVKAIGWFIEEYGVAQISMNLTDLSVTSLHKAFDVTCEQAQHRGMRVSGSELVGVVPLEAILEAGRYFLKKQNRSTGVSDKELIKIAVKSLGLDELYPFEPDKKIIEYILEKENSMSAMRLVNMSLVDFAEETASESPAPGGGSISAYMGVLGVSLGGMVANLSAHKRGWDAKCEEFSMWAEKAKGFQSKLLCLVDDDTQAFNQIMEAFALPKKTAEEKSKRLEGIKDATIQAIEIPFSMMTICVDSLELMSEMAKIGNQNSITDVGVGTIAAVAAIHGAYLNVKINAVNYLNDDSVAEILNAAEAILTLSKEKEKSILGLVYSKI